MLEMLRFSDAMERAVTVIGGCCAGPCRWGASRRGRPPPTARVATGSGEVVEEDLALLSTLAWRMTLLSVEMWTLRSFRSAGKVLFISPLIPTLAGILPCFIIKSTLVSELIPDAASA